MEITDDMRFFVSKMDGETKRQFISSLSKKDRNKFLKGWFVI